MAAAVLAVRYVPVIADALTRPAPGFVSHYVAARVLLEGTDVDRLYDPQWFRQRLTEYEPTVVDEYVLPPTGALLIVPLAPFDYRTARALWLALSCLILAVAGAWLLRSLDLRGVWVPLAVIAVLLYQPAQENLRHGQSYFVFFGLVVLAWRGERVRRPISGGAALAALLLMRVAAPLLWLRLLLERRWRLFASATAIAAIVTLTTFPWMGVTSWASMRREIGTYVRGPFVAVTAHQTVPSFARHLFEAEPVLSPHPLYDSPVLASLVMYGGTIVVLAGAALVSLRHINFDLSFAAFVLAGVMLSPFSLDYHYVLVLVPLAILARRFDRCRSLPYGIALAAGYALIAADLPYRSPAVSGGAWAILAYPKLYGAAVLWALAVGDDLFGLGPTTAESALE